MFRSSSPLTCAFSRGNRIVAKRLKNRHLVLRRRNRLHFDHRAQQVLDDTLLAFLARLLDLLDLDVGLLICLLLGLLVARRVLNVPASQLPTILHRDISHPAVGKGNLAHEILWYAPYLGLELLVLRLLLCAVRLYLLLGLVSRLLDSLRPICSPLERRPFPLLSYCCSAELLRTLSGCGETQIG
jgi:hypothetical protein